VWWWKKQETSEKVEQGSLKKRAFLLLFIATV
jgi:hypothetical protein